MKEKSKNNKIKKQKGITLIALVITVVVMLIISSVTVSLLTGDNGLIKQIKNVKIRTEISNLEEAISVYTLNKRLENVNEDIEIYPILKEGTEYKTLENTLTEEERNNLPEDLKYLLLSFTINKTGSDFPTLDMLDYKQFYKLDEEKFNIPREWKDGLYLYFDNNSYKVININGVEYWDSIIYKLIPFDNDAEPIYVPIGNNTYKLYGDGTLKVLGQLNYNSGITEEEQKIIDSFNEFNLKEINEKFGNKMSLDINGNAKKIYFSCYTAYVIDQNNDLWAWGNNLYNKLGLGNSYLVVEPTKIYSNVKNVWAGHVNTYIVTNDNLILGAGLNKYGALGQGNFNEYKSFVQININGISGEDVEEIYCAAMGMDSTMIKCKESVGGYVYAAGRNSYGQFGLGNNSNKNTFIKLGDDFTNAKPEQIQFNGRTTFILKDNGDLYGCGQNLTGSLGIGDFVNRNELTFIRSNVADVKCDIIESTIIKDLTGKIHIVIRNTNNFVEVSNIPANIDSKLIGGNLIINNGKVYFIDIDTVVAEVVYEGNKNYIATNNIITRVINYDNKLYIKDVNITNPGFLSNYDLRTVMKDVIYFSNSSKLVLITKNGEIYEDGFVKNTELANIRKIVTNGSSSFALNNSGELYAKGGEYTGLWGSTEEKVNYEKITYDGVNYINDIKDIFANNNSHAMYFITNDNEIYYAGHTSYIYMPGSIKGDLSEGGNNNVITAYPKKVESEQLNIIKDKIVDIKFSSITGGISAKVTLILTNDGKIYVMSNNANTSGKNKIISNDFEELVIKEGVKVKEIYTANAFNIVLLENGEVYAWGYNEYGLMGNGYELGGIYSTPQKLNIDNIESISLGNNFMILKSKTGLIYGIGKNEYGQLGTGDNISRTEFVRCPMLEK